MDVYDIKIHWGVTVGNVYENKNIYFKTKKNN